jgi:pimeloyl-ACP methyl ester carboxylesterase
MPFARISGIELYYEVNDFTRPWEGEAETLVLLHGLHGHLLWWNWYQVADLAQYYRVVTVDQRGHGRSYKPATGYSIETMAEDVYQLVRQLGVDKVHIGGASMGGMVSLQFALAHPELVRSVVLVDSYPHTPVVIQDAIQSWIADTETRGYATVMATFNDDYAAALFSPGFRAQHPEFPKYETKLVLDNLMPDEAFIGCCRAIQEFNVEDRLGEIAAPVLIVTSIEGMAYTESLRMSQVLPHAQLWAPTDVGHSPHVEIPAEFNRRVLDFLRTL